MKETKCRLFEGCEAPLCPLDKGSIEQGVWYADEAICRARKFQSLPWLKRQKKIIKFGLTYDDGYFTVKMLEAIKALTKSIKGANPDNWNSEEQWIKERLGITEVKKGGRFHS